MIPRFTTFPFNCTKKILFSLNNIVPKNIQLDYELRALSLILLVLLIKLVYLREITKIFIIIPDMSVVIFDG